MLNREGLFISECFNLGFDLVFLLLFTHRFCSLRSHSLTDRYKNYFPKLRILFSLVYVALSVALLVYNLAVREYDSKAAYEYVLEGGGGQCIDSAILLIQLGVLRLQLRKEQPYTSSHILYFSYLALISVIRFGFMLYSITQDTDRTVPVVLCCLFLLDSVVQLVYWLCRRQSLPQFRQVTAGDISPIEQSPVVRLDADQSYWRMNADHFPFILPFVQVDHGQIHITLQAAHYDLEAPSDRADESADNHPQHLTLLKKSNASAAHTMETLSSRDYRHDELQRIYTECGRFPLEHTVELEEDDLPQLAREWQHFLEELFRERRWYQPAVLRHFHLNRASVRQYEERLAHNASREAALELDCTLGVPLGEDKNAVYSSVVVYKHLWVSDHYEFYMKNTLTYGDRTPSYPIKRYSEFEGLHNSVRQTCRVLGLHYSLPPLPPKHLFHWTDDQHISARRHALERFIRSLSNDPHLMATPSINRTVMSFLDHAYSGKEPEPAYPEHYYQGATIVKGEISKAMVGSECVTFYEFYLMREGEELRRISKRFSEIEELHRELHRWMDNVQICYKAVNLPEKHMKKSEVLRHEKVRHYLQSVVQIHQVERLYPVNSFFNVFGNQPTRFSDFSTIQQLSKTNSKESAQLKLSHIELQESRPHNPSVSSKSSRRFSQIINDLGNEELD